MQSAQNPSRDLVVGVGRPSRRETALADVYEGLSHGDNLKEAARHAGIGYATLRRWIDEDEEIAGVVRGIRRQYQEWAQPGQYQCLKLQIREDRLNWLRRFNRF